MAIDDMTTVELGSDSISRKWGQTPIRANGGLTPGADSKFANWSLTPIRANGV